MNKVTLLERLQQKKDNFIDENLITISKKATALQKKLLDVITNEYILKLKLDVNGNLINSIDNFRVLNQFDDLMNDFSTKYIKPFVINIGQNMSNLTALNADYYNAMGGVNDLTLKNIKQNLAIINERIGLTKNNEIIKGSYLDDLAKTPELRTEIKDYITKNIVNQSGVKEYQKGFNDILSNKNQNNGTAIDGSFTRYYKQYTYDTFNQTDASINNYFAKNIGLNYFIYSGTIIKGSRCFCKKRNNKVFSVQDAEQWINDKTLQNIDNYNPLIDRGGYNCRHNIRYISEEYAMELGYNKMKAQEINNETCK